jgi:serine/threonine-protein kinase
MSTGSGGPSVPKKIFDYDVIDHLGEGARSQIYAVSHPKTKQLYALKHVKRTNEKDDRFIEQLVTEYEIGQKVNHPNLRRPVDLKLSRNLLRTVTEAALVLELFDGSPLDEHCPRSISHLLQIFIETGKALEAMHRQNLLHCDLKPNNILLGPSGHVKVIDLGQACAVGTEKKRIQGTPDYIAPEQVKLRPVSVRTDIYNLGATMYWALTQKAVPTLYTMKKLMKKSIAGSLDSFITPPHVLNPMVPETLSNFVLECVRSDPRKRPADMSEVVRRLEIIEHTVHRDRKAGSSSSVA